MRNKLIKGVLNKSGRNSRGKITAYHRGGGLKRKSKNVWLKDWVPGLVGKIVKVERNLNRSGFLALIAASNKMLFYIPLVNECRVGDYIVRPGGGYSYKGVNTFGYQTKLSSVLEGSYVCNLEKYPGSGAVYLRGSGVFGLVIKKYDNINQVVIKLASGVLKTWRGDC